MNNPARWGSKGGANQVGHPRSSGCLDPKLKPDSKSAKRKIQPNPDTKLTIISAGFSDAPVTNAWRELGLYSRRSPRWPGTRGQRSAGTATWFRLRNRDRRHHSVWFKLSFYSTELAISTSFRAAASGSRATIAKVAEHLNSQPDAHQSWIYPACTRSPICSMLSNALVQRRRSTLSFPRRAHDQSYASAVHISK